MVVLLIAFVIYAFLLSGAVLFVVCAAIPPLRSYSLSAALWLAVWGPCVVGLMMFAGIAVVAQGFATQHGDATNLHLPEARTLVNGYVMVGVFLTILVATVVAWFHQLLIHRMTFVLFRLYVTGVCVGIGSVYVIALSLWLVHLEVKDSWLIFIPATVALLAGFGVVAFRFASSLRGSHPITLNWISEEEFAESPHG